MFQRLTYRKRHSYATKSNQHRVVKTPGGSYYIRALRRGQVDRNVLLLKKESKGYLRIPHLRPAEYRSTRLSRNLRTVNRAYGGVLSGDAIRERIVRAFLVAEQKIVKKVLKIQMAKEKQASRK